jgi:hypothetical protein
MVVLFKIQTFHTDWRAIKFSPQNYFYAHLIDFRGKNATATTDMFLERNK